jgi:hypothetical protein
MIHGGDSNKVKPDRVYLRMLSAANGYQYSKENNYASMGNSKTTNF